MDAALTVTTLPARWARTAFLPKVYFDAVNRAGGIAVLLPPQEDASRPAI